MIGTLSSSASTSSSDSSKKKNKAKSSTAPDMPKVSPPAQDPSKSTPFKHTRLPAKKHHPPPTSAEFWDIDLYLNRFIPAPRLHLLPTYLSRFLGYRTPSQIQKPIPLPLSALSTFFGTFISIVVTVWIFHLFPRLSNVEVNPLIIASLGANAVLEFTALSSPLSQPRALLLSSPMAAIIGVSISKGFMSLNSNPVESQGTESGNARYEELEWLAGALAVAISSFIMVVTKTVHPPAGATALIAVVTPEGRGLGWWLILLVFLGSAIIGIVGLVVNNAMVCRRWPVFWWTEHPLKKMMEVGDEECLRTEGVFVDKEDEKEERNGGPARNLSRTLSRRRSSIGKRLSLGRRLSRVQSDGEKRDEEDPNGLQREATEELDGHFILEQPLHIPRHLEVSFEEMAVLRGLRERLRKGSSVIMEGGEPPEIASRAPTKP